MEALYEKRDSREGEKSVFCLTEARHRASRDIGVVKSVRNSDGAILREPDEVRRRWKEYFARLPDETPPHYIISLVKDTYDGFTTTVRTPHGHSGAVDVAVGVRQGSALSTFLSLFRMDVITEKLMDGPLKTILYADIALIAESKKEFQDQIQKWQKVQAD
uniref:Reverse transcriptase domain-containing protein n=1 Tax=Haemonchus contortus TaxID=6289 RepID=A0A7I4Y216_HAECO